MMKRMLAVVAVVLGTLAMGLTTAPATVAGAAGPTTTIYDSTQAGASSLVSQCFDCEQMSQIGNQVSFAPGTPRTLNSVTVQLESWGCQGGGVYTDNCVSVSPTFNYPVTLNLYDVGADGTSVGNPITSVTQTFAIKYRPTADDTHCPSADYGGAGLWYDASTSTCHYGIASPITFSIPDITVPDNLVYGISLSTSDSATDPTPCAEQPTGCPADSLNVGLTTTDDDQPSVGSDPLPGTLYHDSSYAAFYCDDGAGGTGTFRPDLPLDFASNPSDPQDSCWSSNPVTTSINGGNNSYGAAPYYVPAVQFNAESRCTSTCYVNAATGNDSNAGTADSPFATIQQGVDSVSPGGTVDVAAGTYDEGVNIDKSVNLLGANAGTPATGTRAPESIVTQTGGTSSVFDITTAAPVTIDGFTGTFTGTDQPGQVTVGGLVFDTQSDNSLTFSDNIVSGSTFNNALVYDTSAINSTLTDNEFTGTGQIGAGATGIVATWGSGSAQDVLDITGNTFDGLTETTADGTPAINLNDSGGVVEDNTFTNLHQYGILIADTLDNLTISDNTFSGIYNSTPGSSSNRGSGVRTFENPDFAGPVTVEDNTFTNMYHAVDVANDGSPADLSSGNFTVTHNLFDGPFDGSGTGLGSTDSTAVNVATGTTGTLDATCNWWGSANGAAADQYSGSVDVSPNLFAASPSATCGVPAAPAITSAASTTFLPNSPGTFTVTATGTPTPTFSESGTLPPGISLNATTGVLSGTTSEGGSFPITISATNGVTPVATQSFTLTVTSNTAVIDSGSTAQIAAGKSLHFTVTTTGHPVATVRAVGLPGWMTFTPGTGSRAGTAKLGGRGPAAGGSYTFSIHANNGIGPDTVQTFTANVLAISSPAAVNFSKSGPPTQSFTITTTGAGAGVTISVNLGIPEAGLTFQDLGDGTATISGTPRATAHTHTITVTATSGAATTKQRLAIGISS